MLDDWIVITDDDLFTIWVFENPDVYNKETECEEISDGIFRFTKKLTPECGVREG